MPIQGRKTVRRRSGEIKGNIDGCQPFLLLATNNGAAKALRGLKSRATEGRYVINPVAGNALTSRRGVVLPAAGCKNDTMRLALPGLRDLVEVDNPDLDFVNRQRQIQTRLDAVFGGALEVDTGLPLDGFVRLRQTPALFETLADHFQYVSLLLDDPDGPAKPIEYQPFRWRSRGDFMNWFYPLDDEQDHWGWYRCEPYIVFSRIGLLGDFFTGSSSPHQLAVHLGHFAQVAEGVKNEPVSIKFRMERRWPKLKLQAGNEHVDIFLSSVYPPFEDMLAWIRMVARGALPAQLRIEEEGPDKNIIAFDTGEPERTLLVIGDYDWEEVYVQAVVSRQALVSHFKSALRHFFTSGFEPKNWQEWEPNDAGGQLKQRMLADPWLKR